jgi:hypothetical protein
VVESGGSITVRPNDSSEEISSIRLAALYFDKVAYPTNRMIYVEHGDPSFKKLSQIGFAEEVTIEYDRLIAGLLPDGSPLFGHSVGRSYAFLNSREPGCWAISGSDDYLPQRAAEVSLNCLLVELISLLPVPTNDTDPLELLRFNKEHRNQLLQLRVAIGKMAQKIAASSTPEITRSLVEEELIANLEDIRNSLERRRIPSFLSNITFGIALPSCAIELLASKCGVPPGIGSILGGAVSASWAYSPFSRAKISTPADFMYVQKSMRKFSSN